MDTITHAISGAVIGIASGTGAKDAEKLSLKKRAAIGGFAAAFPDSDFVISLFADHFTYLNLHRGVTHSVLLLPLWAVALGFLIAFMFRMKNRFPDVALVAGLGIGVHIVGDIVTSYGTKIFAPFSDLAVSFPITFIIDLVFTALMVSGLIVALARRSAWPANIALFALLAYFGLQALMHMQAERIGREYASVNDLSGNQILVFPQPFSPFFWKVVVVADEQYHRAYIDLIGNKIPEKPAEDASVFTKMISAYRPVEELTWRVYRRYPPAAHQRMKAIQAWSQYEFAGFREFALLPYVYSMTHENNTICVWFTDLRFTLKGMRSPFRYAMCEY
ncbi:MAG: metal-dependent hydrolase, partial [Gammaproteobacteria bacterium]|nr:metal-dependent hydrolase [Gammaproteobacteria bacterium]